MSLEQDLSGSQTPDSRLQTAFVARATFLFVRFRLIFGGGNFTRNAVFVNTKIEDSFQNRFTTETAHQAFGCALE